MVTLGARFGQSRRRVDSCREGTQTRWLRDKFFLHRQRNIVDIGVVRTVHSIHSVRAPRFRSGSNFLHTAENRSVRSLGTRTSPAFAHTGNDRTDDRDDRTDDRTDEGKTCP